MLAEGFSTRRGRRGALIHHDAVNHVLRGRRGARLTALTSGGAIPDTADYQVRRSSRKTRSIGTVNEDFAVESMAGDIFQLGNSVLAHPARRARHRAGRGRARPAADAFRSGSARRRAAATSCRWRCRGCARRSPRAWPTDPAGDSALRWLVDEVGHRRAGRTPARRVPGRGACGAGLPADAGHARARALLRRGRRHAARGPLAFGSRINRAWGLALRKRFCRKFNFELQAAATEDSIVLSLTTAHSFELAEVARYLHSATRRGRC